MIRSQTKIVAHTSALVIRRRVDDDGGHATLNKFPPASNEEIIGSEFDLVFFLPQPNESTSAGE